MRSLRREDSRIGASKRLVFKSGEFNISQTGIKKRHQQYLADIFTTLVELKWRWSLLLILTGFLLTWLLFGAVWWALAYYKGDIDRGPGHPVCLIGIDGYIAALLFSIETQQTVGYGTRSPDSGCPEALLVVMLQATIGVIIQALMTGLVFAKLARPQKRAETLMFSKTACICQRDGELVLVFRVGDMRTSHIIGARMDALLVRRRVTQEGEIIPLETENVDLGFANTRLLLSWPVIIEHKINEKSPFWKLCRNDLERENFELLIILEGSVPSTGASTQAMTSYLPDEIRWGYRFERLITHQRDDGKYMFDYASFHNTIEVDLPFCSAADLAYGSFNLHQQEKSMDWNRNTIHDWIKASAPPSNYSQGSDEILPQYQIMKTVPSQVTLSVTDSVSDRDGFSLADTHVKMRCESIQAASFTNEVYEATENEVHIFIENEPSNHETSAF